jgi:hypothetical protein
MAKRAPARKRPRKAKPSTKGLASKCQCEHEREKALDRISADDISVADIVCHLSIVFPMICNTCSR